MVKILKNIDNCFDKIKTPVVILMLYLTYGSEVTDLDATKGGF